MRNSLAGFFISSLLHLGVAGLVINLDKSEASRIPEPDQIPLTLEMFQPEPVKPIPVIEPEKISEIVKVEPVIKPVETPVDPEKPVTEAPIESVPEPINKADLKPVVKPIHVTEKEPELVVITKKPKKKKIIKPKPVEKIKKVVNKEKPKPKAVSTATIKKVKPKVVQKQKKKKKKKKKVLSKPVVQVEKVVRKAPTRQAKIIKRATKSTQHRAVKVPAKPQAQITQRVVNQANIVRVELAYKARLRQLIIANKRYPKRAKRRRQQGTANISFLILANGTVTNIKTLKSSGYATLDESAIKAIQKISGKLPFPKELNKKQWLITIPITYRLR